MTRATFCFVLLLCVFNMFGQDLEIKKGRFYNGGTQVRVTEFVETMQSNTEAYQLALKGKSGYSSSNVLGFIGGFMIGLPLGTAVGGGDPKWVLAGAGAAIIAVAIPIQVGAVKKLRSAAEIYNGDGSSNSTSAKIDLNLSSTSIGLVYSF